MKNEPYEIVVLKPTLVFLAFLASQLPEKDWPNFAVLETDATAYVIPQCDSNDETLTFLKKHFSIMFRHEISRWLGPDARNPIENSYMDFVCCFKLQFHAHIILMEPNITQAKQMLLIKPKQSLFDWIQEEIAGDDELSNIMEKATLSQIAENSTALVKNFTGLTTIKPYIDEYYKPLYETAMRRFSTQKQQWPTVHSFVDFYRYFSIEIHTQLIHLSR